MFSEPDAEQEVPVFRTDGGNAAFHNFHNDFGHIQDPNQRRRLALAEIDKIPFGWYHVRAVSVAGIGFFTDSYDLFAMNLALQMVGMTFWQGDNKGVIPLNVQTAIKASISGGAVLGQIGFGVLADLLGRRRMYGIELSIIIVSTLTQSLSAPSSALTMTGLLIFWRAIMGIGIGGDYPMSAIITSEFAPTRWRGSMMAAVFSMQGAGQLAAVLVALIVTFGFRDSFSTPYSTCGIQCQVAADRGWRIIIGTSALPAVFALYYRLTIPETPRYTFDVAQDIEKANADIRAFKDGEAEGHPNALQREQTKLVASASLRQPRASWADFNSYFGTWKNGSLLFATTASWFFVDVVFYGLGLNYNIMLAAIGYGTTEDTVYRNLFTTAIGNLIIVCAGSIPGYWLSVILIDTTGRRIIQIGGFAILTLLFSVIGFAYNLLSQGALLALYILVQLFFSFGPNTTTFIVPGECFPTRYRSTGHGISAAGGKIGATVAQIMALTLVNKDAPPNCNSNGKECDPWVQHLMQIFACFMLCGALVSFLIPETKRRTLEELAGEKPLYKTKSSRATSSESKKPISSPVLSQMRSPHLSPMANGEEDGGKKGHIRTSSGEFGTDSSERSLRHLGGVLSDNYPSWNGSSGSANGGVANRDGSLFWMESIPLQDMGGLVLK